MIFTSILFSTLVTSTGPQVVFMHEHGAIKQIEAADLDGKNIRALTDGSELALYPHISGDSKWLSYSEGKDEQHLAVKIKNLETGAEETLVPANGMNLHADLSRDGEHLVWSGPKTEGAANQIGLIDLNHTKKKADEPAKITWIETSGAAYFPAVSSDAGFVVFQRNASAQVKEVVVYNFETEKNKSPFRVISFEGGKSMSPSLSFDDRYVAFTSLVEGNWDIYVMDLQAKDAKPVRITTDPAQDFAPTFTPDGGIIFASNRTGNFQLYSISHDAIANKSFESRLIVQEEGTTYSPSVSGSRAYVQKNLAPMSEPPRSSFGAIRNGDRIYVVGGHAGKGHNYPKESFLNKVEYLDLKTNTWHDAAPRPSVGHGFGLVSYKQYIYAFGAFSYSADHDPQWKSLDVIERYDTEKDEWTLVGHMPRPRSSNIVAQVGSKVYLIGGWDSTPKHAGDLEGTFQRAIDVFDLETERASETSLQLPDPLRRAFTAVVRGHSILLIGGLGVGSDHFSLVDKVTVFNTDTNEWSELPPLPYATFAPASEMIGDKLFVFGGLNMTTQNYNAHIFEIDLSQKNPEWQHSGRFVSEPKGFSQVIKVDESTLAILGGHAPTADGGDLPVLSVEEFHAIY